MNAKEAMGVISSNLEKIRDLYNECEELGKEHNLEFHYSGPAGYGDSGWFKEKENYYGEIQHWNPSSESC